MTSEISSVRPVEPYVTPAAETTQAATIEEAPVAHEAATETNPQVVSLSVMYGFVVGPDGVARCQAINP